MSLSGRRGASEMLARPAICRYIGAAADGAACALSLGTQECIHTLVTICGRHGRHRAAFATGPLRGPS
jgi:hypothetical protein